MISPYFSFVQRLLSLELMNHFYRAIEYYSYIEAKPTHVKEDAQLFSGLVSNQSNASYDVKLVDQWAEMISITITRG